MMVNSKLSALFVRNFQQLIKHRQKIQPQPNSIIRIGCKACWLTFQCSTSMEKTAFQWNLELRDIQLQKKLITHHITQSQMSILDPDPPTPPPKV